MNIFGVSQAGERGRQQFSEPRNGEGGTPSHRIRLALATSLTAACLTLASPTGTAQTLPILWEAGGQSAGTDSAGQAARIATDAFGNVAVVSGPASAANLAVTSYTSAGAFRWQSEISPSPSSGTFVGDWIAAAPNGDFVAVGRTLNSSGTAIAIAVVRFNSNGAFQWRVNVPGTLPSVGRLLVDSGGNAYLAFNALGDGQDIRLHKYSPGGALLWSEFINTGLLSNNIATSLVLSADETEVVAVGDTIGGSEWITALYDTTTGVRKWLVVAPEGTAALDVVMDANRVYVTGQGHVGINGFLTVVAYDRANGAKLWRTDKRPVGSGIAAGLRMAMAPDGSLVATGQALLGFLDWYTVAFETSGVVRWEAVRDGGLNTDEIPAAILVLPNGTTVVSGRGGPSLTGGFWPGITAGYSPSGTLIWEAISPLVTLWVTALPTGDVVATGGYDAYLAAFRPPGGIGAPYCQANANSTGSPGRIEANGSLVVADNNLTLRASDLPPNMFGIFFFGPNLLQSPFGDSFLCVGGTLLRLQPATMADASGVTTRIVDLTAFPAAGSLVPGTTVNFQHWYRDPAAMMNGFSLTNAVSLTFQ